MKKDNVLKKEFKKNDVERMRNLVKGKTGAKTTQGVGYSKKYEHHKEGDIWEEDNRKWTIKNGIKQNITKMDKVKELGLTPLFCPSCNKLMNHPNDKLMYKNHMKCFDCMVEFETKLRQEGKWEQYQNDIRNEGIDKMIVDYKNFIKEKLNEANNGYVTEQGDVESWVGGFDKEKILNEMEDGIKYLESLKKS